MKHQYTYVSVLFCKSFFFTQPPAEAKTNYFQQKFSLFFFKLSIASSSSQVLVTKHRTVISIHESFVSYFFFFFFLSLSLSSIAHRLCTVVAIVIYPNVVNTTPSMHHNRTKHVDCERQCPYIYYPICGSNGNETENRMFVNHCELNAFNCDATKSEQITKLWVLAFR